MVINIEEHGPLKNNCILQYSVIKDGIWTSASDSLKPLQSCVNSPRCIKPLQAMAASIVS
jgi:hypothetical protein